MNEDDLKAIAKKAVDEKETKDKVDLESKAKIKETKAQVLGDTTVKENKWGDVAKGLKMVITGKAGQTVGDEGEGGNLVPTALSRSVEELLRDRLILSGRARQFTMSAAKEDVPVNTQHSSVEGVAENTAPGETGVLFGKVPLAANEYSGWASISYMLRQSAAVSPGIAEYVTNDLVDSLAEQIENDFINGDGTGNTLTGLKSEFKAANSKFNVVSAAGAVNVIAVAEIDSLIASLPGKYRSRGVIYCDDQAWGLMQNLNTGMQNLAVTPVNAQSDPQAVGLWRGRYPIVLVDKGFGNDNTIGGVTAEKAGAILFGDLSRAMVVGRFRGVDTAEDVYFDFSARKSAVRVVSLIDANVLRGEAMSVLGYQAKA